MSSIAVALAEVLNAARRPGDFFTSGAVEMFAPRLEVDGVGLVALPLLAIQAEQLIAIAERAPYGRGGDTLIDTEVRRTWQIGADRVRIGGKHWARTLEGILTRVAEGLGVGERITAEFYKLLVYDKGSFFVGHRDTEKTPGMFATLVLVLPSVSTGGELVVRHKDREVTLDLQCAEPSEAAFAAFYADCVHEVLPLASGFRSALVFNLLRGSKSPNLGPPSYEVEQSRAMALLQQWAAGQPSSDDGAPEKLIYPLEHAYTPAELDFDKLKGADAAAAGVLVDAAARAGCDLHLAQVSIEESGAAECSVDLGSRRGRWSDEDEFEAGEVFDRYAYLSEWRRPDGSPSTLGKLPVDDEDICPPGALEDMEADEELFHEATGNEGASFERTYRRAALVLWPSQRMLAVLNQAGLSATLPYLDDLTERWIAGGGARQSALWFQAHELAAHMLSSWPKDEWHRSDDKAPSERARMLTLLTRLEDTERIEAFVDVLIASGHHEKGDNEAMVGALRLLSSDRATALMKRMVRGTSATSLDGCSGLLALAVAAFPNDVTGLLGAGAALVEALPSDASTAPPRDSWPRVHGVRPGVFVDFFGALARIDESLAERAVAHALAWPKTYDLDTVLVPSLRQLIGSVAANHGTALPSLRQACLQHLGARAALPLEAPRDWNRAKKLACRCPHCGELGRFLADPGRRIWIFKAAEAARSHIDQTIRQARCDLDTATDRRGRPYSLVCTKNQASYDRQVKQRNQDLADLEQFGR